MLNGNLRIASVPLAAALLLAFACGAPTPPPSESIDPVLQSAVEAGKVRGVVVAAASRDGVLYEGAFGAKDAAAGEPMAADTIFRIASMTKAVTSVAVMQLVEQGRLKLDDSARDHLPELGDPQVLEGFGDDGTPKLRAAARPPTIRELLSHTSGYAYHVWDASMNRYQEQVELPAGRERYFKLPLIFDPGTRWQYGPGPEVTGIIVETLSGLTLEEYFQRNIFEPLGISDTFFQVPAGKWSRFARTYRREADGAVSENARPKPEAPPEVTFFSGGGGLYSTAPDYIRFMRALLNGGELDGARILKPETVELMAQNHIGEHEAGNLTSVLPDSSEDFALFPESVDHFGLGFFINSEALPGGRASGSLAWAGFRNTYFWIDPERDVCGVLLTQLHPFADTTTLELLTDYERAVYSAFRSN